MDDNETTTNSNEGWNIVVKLFIPRKVSVWMVVLQFKKEDSMVKVKLREAAKGPSPEAGKNRAILMEKRREELKNMVNNYDSLFFQGYFDYMLDNYNYNGQLDFIE